jgi:hypothetical protein
MPFFELCKWLLLPIVTAAVLAFECDDYVAENRDPAWLRWIEGAALAIIMAAAGFVVVRWIHETSIPPRVLLPILLSASMGFLFGATIPSGYRRLLRQTGDARCDDSRLAVASLVVPYMSAISTAARSADTAVSGTGPKETARTTGAASTAADLLLP